MRLRNGGQLREVVERHRLPFATTTMAKGLIPEDHPLALGCIERARRQVQRQILRTGQLDVGLAQLGAHVSRHATPVEHVVKPLG